MFLTLNLHCHQPVGNFGWVFERATERCYRPLFQELQQHSNCAIVLHVSGPLLEWWQEHAPGVLDLIERGVLDFGWELQCGGMYEPILPVLPRDDLIAQIASHQDWLHRRFAVRPTSLWLTERVWEPTLPSALVAAGIDNVPLDDHHLEGAGLPREHQDGYFISEDQGLDLCLFSLSHRLRYLMPFQPLEEVFQYLRERHEAGQQLLVYGDDAEKFGLWPRTQEWVFEKGWLRGFLQQLEEASDWLQVRTYRQIREQAPPRRRVYVPAASYEEMEEWALPVSAAAELHELVKSLEDADLLRQARPFLRGALWRNMLARYPESNRIHRRMLQVSQLLRDSSTLKDLGEEHRRNHAATRALYRGQCNCAYWHGVFGGLHLPFLRGAVVAQLLLARDLEGSERGRALAKRCEIRDLDGDGLEEVLLEGRGWSLWVSPDRGGIVEVLDHIPTRRDLINVLGRSAELYHEEIRTANALTSEVAEETEQTPDSIHDLSLKLEGDVEDLLRLDPCGRGAFALHLEGSDATLEEMARLMTRQDVASMQQPLRVTHCSSQEFLMTGTWTWGDHQVEVRRSFEIKDDRSLSCRVELSGAAEDSGALPIAGRVAMRLDLSTPAAGAETRYFQLENGERIPPEQEHRFQGTQLHCVDEGACYRWSWSRPGDGILLPLRTVSRSESAAEIIQQGSTVVVAFAVELSAAARWDVQFALSVTEQVP